MSEKRKDTKGRILKNGERQRPNGQYEYRYRDMKGEWHSVYSWRLVETDKNPKGKKSTDPLRTIEANINHDIEDGISTIDANKRTVNDMFESFMSVKTGLKQTTLFTYRYMYDNFIKDSIGLRTIASVKYSDIKKFYIELVSERKLSPSSMEMINSILNPIFSFAVRDNIIRSNPAQGVMREMKRDNGWEKTKRHALTIQQQTALVEFCKNSPTYTRWVPVIVTLLGTGCRVSELIGLRWEDCDFERNTISVNHGLIRVCQQDKQAHKTITAPKTKSGERLIPMLSAVRKVLIEEYKRQLKHGFCTEVIDGCSGFVFQTSRGTAQTSGGIDSMLIRMTAAYNKKEEMLALKENRQPALLPHFTAHHLRHTFCTRFCENETNLKVIQDIMGHANISTTMNVYNEATMDKKFESISNLDSKILI